MEEMPEFAFRMKVKAGLAGYAQVYGKYNTTPYDKLKLDLTYIEDYSVWMDIKLMLLTLKILFKAESTEGVDSKQITAMKKMCIRDRLNWAYIGITAFLAGFAVLAPFGRKISEKETGYVCRTGTGVLMAGLAFITVYAQVFSLFSGVGLGANVLLLLACAVCVALLRRQLARCV